MNTTSIGSNQRQATFPDGTVVLISYDTPVAAVYKGRVYRTSAWFSPTTTKHINKWIASFGDNSVEEKPQDFFYLLLDFGASGFLPSPTIKTIKAKATLVS